MPCGARKGIWGPSGPPPQRRRQTGTRPASSPRSSWGSARGATPGTPGAPAAANQGNHTIKLLIIKKSNGTTPHTTQLTWLRIGGSCLKTGQHSIFVIIRKIKNWYTYVGYRKLMILYSLWSNIFIIRIIIIIIIGNKKKIKQYLGYGIKNYTFNGQ